MLLLGFFMCNKKKILIKFALKKQTNHWLMYWTISGICLTSVILWPRGKYDKGQPGFSLCSWLCFVCLDSILTLSSKGGRLIAADPAYILAGSNGRTISPLKYSKLTGWGLGIGCILRVWREHHKAPNLGVDKGITFQKEIRVKSPNNKEWLIDSQKNICCTWPKELKVVVGFFFFFFRLGLKQSDYDVPWCSYCPISWAWSLLSFLDQHIWKIFSYCFLKYFSTSHFFFSVKNLGYISGYVKLFYNSLMPCSFFFFFSFCNCFPCFILDTFRTFCLQIHKCFLQ